MVNVIRTDTSKIIFYLEVDEKITSLLVLKPSILFYISEPFTYERISKIWFCVAYKFSYKFLMQRISFKLFAQCKKIDHCLNGWPTLLLILRKTKINSMVKLLVLLGFQKKTFSKHSWLMNHWFWSEVRQKYFLNEQR